jgi:RNA polymerase sigma-70 factor (ECF subfamily)
VATPKQIDEFLAESEKKAFKRCLYHVKDTDAALDIVQDSMMKLVEHYSNKPIEELPLLFQRILTNGMLDWFRRQKTRKALIVNLSELAGDSEDSFDIQEWAARDSLLDENDPSSLVGQWQTLEVLDELIKQLPSRQREAFLLRYLEELDVSQTAAIMGCTEGSVKTHSFRAVQALSKQLIQRGIKS